MTKDEYEARQRRLYADIEDARKALVLAQSRFDELCRDSRILRVEWRKQEGRRQATAYMRWTDAASEDIGP